MEELSFELLTGKKYKVNSVIKTKHMIGLQKVGLLDSGDGTITEETSKNLLTNKEGCLFQAIKSIFDLSDKQEKEIEKNIEEVIVKEFLNGIASFFGSLRHL